MRPTLVYEEITSPAPPLRLPSPSRPPARTRRAQWLIVPLFPGGADPGDSTAHGGAAHRESGHNLYVVAAILEGGKGTLLEILLQELDGFVVQLRSGSGGFFGARDSPLLALSAYLLTEERLTEKVRAA